MNQIEQGQLASVSDVAFARAMWRHTERGNIDAAKDVREQWKHSKESEGYGAGGGALSVHEITAFAKQHLAGAGGDVVSFARAIERAALIKAYTLLPELRQAEEAKRHRRYYRDGVNWGLITYSGAIRALAMGQAQDEPEATAPAKPRRIASAAKTERDVDADAARPKFEAWAGARQFDLRRQDGAYTNIVTAYTWMGWLAAVDGKEGGNAKS